jgi:hypothetical protein
MSAKKRRPRRRCRRLTAIRARSYPLKAPAIRHRPQRRSSAAAPLDPEAAAAAEEAAGSEEMSKLIDQYSEPQEGTAQNEIIEVQVVRTPSRAWWWTSAGSPRG